MIDSPPRQRASESASPDLPLAAMHVSVDIGFAVLLVVCAVRYFSYHPFDTVGATALTLGVGSGLAYALGAVARPGPRRRRLGIVLAAALWLPLAVLAPSFGWCAFPLFFALHRVLGRRTAMLGSAMLVIAVSTGLFFMSNGEDLGLVLGPFFGGLMLSLAVDALERALENRRRLNIDLLNTQEQLARSEREAGALAERHRLASELHDTVVQRTASALLLLESDGGVGSRSETTAAGAREILREALVETRQLMHGLATAEDRASLTSTIAALAEEHGAEHTVVGSEVDLHADVIHAFLRVAREALINAAKHSGASTTRVTITYFDRAVGIDIADDGAGFDPDEVRAHTTGYGLRAMAWRIESVGGAFTVESTPGRGTVVAGVVPVSSDAGGMP